MPAPERAHRLNDIQQSLPGLEIAEDLEPSDALVDKFAAMQEVTGALRYIPLHELGRRDQEAKGIKRESWWKPDSNGALRQHLVNVEIDADVSTDYKLHRALLRRGVAMHMARLLNYQIHDTLVRWLMREYQREPIVGYAKVSLEQLLRADQEVFTRLAELTRSGLGRNPIDQSFALDAHLPFVISEPRI